MMYVYPINYKVGFNSQHGTGNKIPMQLIKLVQQYGGKPEDYLDKLDPKTRKTAEKALRIRHSRHSNHKPPHQ